MKSTHASFDLVANYLQNVVRRFFWISLWLFSLGVLLGYGLRWWPGDSVILIRLFTSLMPWLLVGLIPSFILALAGRRYWLLLVVSLALGPALYTFNPLFLPRMQPVVAGQEPLKVMSYNVWRRNEDMAAVARVIRQEQPDILLLQEIKLVQWNALLPQLQTLYPEVTPYVAYKPGLMQGLISRFPVETYETFRKGRVQKSVVETPDGPVQVWNVHPHAFPWRWQVKEFRLLAEEIAAVEGPLILGGDFNTTDQAETYQLIAQHLDNAHWEAGWGFGFTYPAPGTRHLGDIPLPSVIRIDHIFYNNYFFVHSAGTLADAGGSDHRPVVALMTRVK